jgi:ubiquinone/menaquinone biosynthesis C-methylase UbiE
MLEREVIREDLHARLLALGQPAEREEQLVLSRLEADASYGGLREPEKRPELAPKSGERSVVGIREVLVGTHKYRVTIYWRGVAGNTVPGREAYTAASMDRSDGLPEYDSQLSAFHRAFEPELAAVLDALPLEPGMRVLDLACGDGFYTRRIAERLGAGGSVVGADLDPAYLARARQEAESYAGPAKIELVEAPFDHLPFEAASFDFVWCAQSLYSLPDPVAVLEHVKRVLKPDGIAAVLENDTLHQVFLPWPAGLEIPLRAAELRALLTESRNPGKYYVGRRLPAVFAAAGVEPWRMTTIAIDRQAPFRDAEREVLQSYLDAVVERVTPYLAEPLLVQLRELADNASPQHLLKQPYLTMTWLNVLALGRCR